MNETASEEAPRKFKGKQTQEVENLANNTTRLYVITLL